MNKTIDPALLQAMGIKLDPQKEAELIDKLQQILEERIGTAIIESLNSDQAAKLEELINNGDEAVTSEWIASNVADYEQIVSDEYDILMGEVAQDADKF